MSDDNIQKLLEEKRQLGNMQYDLMVAARALVKKLVPDATEEIKYGGILFSKGIDFCGIFAYKKHVSIEFSYGAGIDDTFGLLEGKGKGRRHVKLESPEDIETKRVADYIPLALVAALASDQD